MPPPPPPTKAKTTKPCDSPGGVVTTPKASFPAVATPQHPPLRIRGKTPDTSPETIPKQPQQAPPAVKAPSPQPADQPAASAFVRTQQHLEQAKANRLEQKATTDAKQHEPLANTATTAGANGEPTHAPAVAKTPQHAETTGPAPASDTQQHGTNLATVQTELNKPASPDSSSLTTPPPKVTFKSPPVSPPSRMTRLDSMDSQESYWDESWNGGCGQREYYGSRGQSWWRDSGDWGWGHNWWWNANKNEYVVCNGSNSWTVPYDHVSAEASPTEPGESPSPAHVETPGSEHPASADVHSRLAARRPTTDLQDPAEAMKSPGESEAADTASKSGDQAETSPGNQGGQDDGWRRDKKGNLLQAGALYMRFYRKVRSNSS